MPIATQAVFEKVIARPAVTAAGQHGSLVHLWWSAPTQGDRVVQIYLDSQLIDVTARPTQRQAWLMIDRTRPSRIELLAVDPADPDDAWRPMPDLLTHWDPAVVSNATVTVIRDEKLPVDTRLVVSIDGVESDRGAIWPADEHRGGFGALFALGEFGRDAVTGPGLGAGELGMGPLGSEGTAWRWQRNDLPPPGSFSIETRAVDHTGRQVALPVTIDDVAIDALPTAAEALTIDDGFTLQWQ